MYDILRNTSLIWASIHVLILFVFVYRSRFDDKKRNAITVTVMVPMLALNVFILITKGAFVLGQLMVLTMTIPSLILFYILSADRGSRFIFTFCITDTFSYWIILLTNLLDTWLGGTGWIMFIIRLVSFPVAEVFVWKYLRKPYRELQENVKTGWGFFSLITAIYYFLLVAGSVYPTIISERPEDMPVMLGILILMPVTYVAMFKTLQSQFKLYKMSAQTTILENQLENQQTIRKLNHNLKAYIATVDSLIKDGKTEEAIKTMEQLVKVSNVSQKYCDNAYINATLCHFAGMFSANDFPLQIDAFRCPEKVAKYSDVCLMLSNALDNALEAVSKLSRNSKTSVHIATKAAYLVMRIENTCEEFLVIERGTVPESTKAEKGHGIGLATIVDTAERLGGNAVCYAKDGKFTLDISVRL